MHANDMIIAKKTLRSNWIVALIKHNTVKQLDDCLLFLSKGNIVTWPARQNARSAAEAFILHAGCSNMLKTKADAWMDRGWFVFEIMWKDPA
jgi:hypothetical protein